MQIDNTMFYYLLLLYLIINSVSTYNQNQCYQLNKKLIKYNIHINLPQQDFPGLNLCQNLITNQCCPKIYENHIKNITSIELYQLFELYTINIYETIIRLNNDLNQTYINIIENSRNETHLVLQRGYNKLYHSYRLSIDKFFNNILILNSHTYKNDLKIYIDQLFRNILHISLTLNNNQTIYPTYFSCLWKNHPFANNPNLIENQLEIHLGKIFQLNDLLKLSHELVQILSTSVTTDYHCIDSYMQLSYCNLCGGRTELPCLNNCINIIESCLINITLIDDVWRNFIDAMENIAYFDNIEKVLSSIGLSISDAVMTFFNSGGVQNKEIIDQCGHIRTRRQTFSINQKFDDEYSKSLSLSLLDRQLIYISQSLKIYRLFWMKLPEQICKSTGISAINNTTCWTGTSISQDGRSSSIRTHYDKPLNLKLQRILKEMREKSKIIGNLRRTTSVLNIKSTTTNAPPINESKINLIIQNLTDALKSTDLDDYPNDNEFDYSDYAYEDATDETSTTSTTTTTTTTTTHRIIIPTTTMDDEISIDETNTVYYDYGEHDVYSDDELEESSTTEEPIIILTTIRMIPITTTTISDWKNRIPYYHRRPPIIWNVNKDNNDDPNSEKQIAQHNSGSSIHYSLLLLFFFLIFIFRV